MILSARRMTTPNPRSLADRIVLLSTIVTAVSGVLLALTNLNDSLRRARDSLLSVPANVAWAVAIALLLASAVAITTTAKRSRPGRRDAFRLRPDRVEHLHGREDDIDRIIRLLHDNQQVNLIGESGAGKSALLRSGVIPRLVDSHLIAIYLDVLGKDWIRGPESALRVALAAVPHLRDSASLREASLHAATSGHRILLIFDQFDDYESAHPDRFITPRNRTFISVGELVQSNPFWRDIQDLVAAELVHCAFVTRTDSAAGLECVRFAEPRVYLLDRLRTSAVDELLDNLTVDNNEPKPAIDSPEHGWIALRERLVRDLSIDGSVLPAQMTLVLAGLGNFRYLTVREYQRRGGLHGVEGSEVEWHIANTARHANITKAEALAILLTMVDREARKTRARTLAEVAAIAVFLQSDSLRSILQEWESKDLLRRRMDADTGDVVWLLDHDYLSNAVLATEERMNTASILLRDAAADFRSAGTDVLRRWRTLLAPTQQFATWVHRIKGQFRFGENRGFVALSTLRFLPYLAVAAILGVVVYQRHVLQYERAAERLLQDFSMKSGEPGTDTLWMLAESPPETKLYFLQSALRSMTAANQVRSQLGPALHAIVGADAELRERSQEVLREHALGRFEAMPVRLAAVRGLHEIEGIDADVMSKALDFPMDSDLFAGSSPAIDETDWVRLARVGTNDGLASVAARLTGRLQRIGGILESGTLAQDYGAAPVHSFRQVSAADAMNDAMAQAVGERTALAVAVNRLQEKTGIAEVLVARAEGATNVKDATARSSFLFGIDLSNSLRERVKANMLQLVSSSHSPADILHGLYVATRFSRSELSAQQRTLIKRALQNLPASELRCTWSVSAANAIEADAVSSSDAYNLLALIAQSQDAPCQGRDADIVKATLMRRLDRVDLARVVREYGVPSLHAEVSVREPPDPDTTIGSVTGNDRGGRPYRLFTLSNAVLSARREGRNAAAFEAEISSILTVWSNDKQRDLALPDVIRAISVMHQRVPARTVRAILEKCQYLFETVNAQTYLQVLGLLNTLGTTETISLTQRLERASALLKADPLLRRSDPAEIISAVFVNHIRSLPPELARPFVEDLLDDRPSSDADEAIRVVCESATFGRDLRDLLLQHLYVARTDTEAERAIIGLLSLPRIPMQTYVDVFRTPTCGTRCRNEAVALAERRTGKQFVDDWAFLEWARGEFLVVSGTPSRQEPDH